MNDAKHKPQPKKYVLTGASCTGKTTLLTAMSQRGYQCIPEALTLMYNKYLSRGLRIVKYTHKLEVELAKLHLHLESQAKPGNNVFLDRSCIDSLVYCKRLDIKPPSELLELISSQKYDLVFLLNFLPKYETETNPSRWETLEGSKITQRLLKETYEALGYKIISVPPASVADRAQFVIQAIIETEKLNSKHNLFILSQTQKNSP